MVTYNEVWIAFRHTFHCFGKCILARELISGIHEKYVSAVSHAGSLVHAIVGAIIGFRFPIIEDVTLVPDQIQGSVTGIAIDDNDFLGGVALLQDRRQSAEEGEPGIAHNQCNGNERNSAGHRVSFWVFSDTAPAFPNCR